MEKSSPESTPRNLTSGLTINDLSHDTFESDVWRALKHFDFTKAPADKIELLQKAFLADDSCLKSISCELDREMSVSGRLEKFIIQLAETGRIENVTIRSARPGFVEELFSALDPDRIRLLHLYVAYNNATVPFIVQCVNIENLYFRAIHPDNWKEFTEALAEGAFPNLQTLKLSLEIQKENPGGQIHDLKKAFKKCPPTKLRSLDVGPQTLEKLISSAIARGKTLEEACQSLYAVPLSAMNLSFTALANNAIEYIKKHLVDLTLEDLDVLFAKILRDESATSEVAHQMLGIFTDSLPYVLCVIEDFSPNGCLVIAKWLRKRFDECDCFVEYVDKWADVIDTFQRKENLFRSIGPETDAEMNMWRRLLAETVIRDLKGCHKRIRKDAKVNFFTQTLIAIANDPSLSKDLLALGDRPGGRPLWAYVDDYSVLSQLISLKVINPTLDHKGRSLVDLVCDTDRTDHASLQTEFRELALPVLEWVRDNLPAEDRDAFYERFRRKLMLEPCIRQFGDSIKTFMNPIFNILGQPSTEEATAIQRISFAKYLDEGAYSKEQVLAAAIRAFSLFEYSLLPTNKDEAQKYVESEEFRFDASRVVLDAADYVSFVRAGGDPNDFAGTRTNGDDKGSSKRRCIVS